MLKEIEPSPLRSRDLILGLLASCEPLHKLCQSGWEGSLDRTVGDAQALFKLLKVIGAPRLVRHRAGWTRKSNWWGSCREQSLH
jgi:hypothetical protein